MRLSTPRDLRDITWIRGALQTAVALEHSTMPLYSASMFSLEVQNYPSYNAIRSVLMEEMVHMSAVANMVAALGGSPRIRNLDPGYPRFGLPGGVAHDLQLILGQLSPRMLRGYMRLESPDFMLDAGSRRQPYPTVGEFYQGIDEAIVANATAVREAVRSGGPANQVGGNIGFTTIEPTPGVDPVEQLRACISLVREQGEGAASTISAGETYQNEGSHYARFAELAYGARYVPPEPSTPVSPQNEADFFRGEQLAWPVVINTLAVPSDGYDTILNLDPVGSAGARKEIEAFDDVYTAMMIAMDDMWNGPADKSWPSFGEAVKLMNELRVISCFNVMRHQIDPAVIAQLPRLYPTEHELLAQYTDLDAPIFYGPRFRNNAA